MPSSIWNHFRKATEGGTCNYCNARICGQHGNTSNLKRHLQNKHKPEAKRLEEEESKAKPKVSPEHLPINVALVAAAEKGKSNPHIWSSNYVKSKAITNKLAKMVCVDYQPFSLVEDQGFRELMTEMEPRYQIPSRKTLSSEIIPALYKKKKTIIEEKLRQEELYSIAITTDGWTSKATESFIAVTAHYISPSCEIKNFCMAVKHFPQQHTAENLAKGLEEVLGEYNLTPGVTSIPIFVIADNARNIQKAIQNMGAGVEGRGCFAHKLQLVIKDGINKFSGIRNLLTKARAIVGHFKRSTHASAQLAETQKQLQLPVHKLVQDVPTRWNSTLHMTERIVEQKRAISSILASIEQVPNLFPHEWKTAESIITVLKPFEQVTIMISAESYPTISMVIPLLTELENSLIKNNEMNDLRDELIKNIHTRWPEPEEDSLYAPATAVDPRFKFVPFSETKRANAISQLLKLMKENTTVSDINNNTNEKSTSASTSITTSLSLESSPKGHQHFWLSFQQKVESDYNTSGQSVSVDISLEQELGRYRQQPPISLTASPLAWWKQNQLLYPNIFKIARRLLAIPATSVPSERMFSKAGSVVSEKRCSLKGSHVEEITFLNHNWNVA